ncbi:hypothetical protein [Phytoactinopolyspora mesophila]|uniref:hypothetical protein n=1 Tax=Phytoactinopolyspora mesophila TaxID=2650750 RepID=UPI0016520493|nr:hypothetical protein [Phytoactinopolyspora mesophila]
MAAALSVDEIRTFPAAVPLVDAGRAFGLGRTKTHELARAGEFPVPLIKIGSSYRARRSDILDALGIVDAEPAATAS